MTRERDQRATLWGERCLELNDSALQSEHNRVGSITRAQLGKDTFDMSFDRMFRNGELIRNEFVRVTAPDQRQHLDFPRG